MSKGNMLLGHARGKVGSLVFSRSNGKQVVRARAEVIKNPRTETQLVQRIILNTISQAYSKMQPIVDHSFEGVAPGQKSMSFFNKRNMDNLRAKIAATIAAGDTFVECLAYSPLGTNYFVPNEYVIAKGSLPEIKAEFATLGRAAISGLAANTYAAVIDAYGLERGDQLTFVTVDGNMSSGLDFHFARVILDPISAGGESLPLETPFIGENVINKPNGRNEGTFSTLVYSGSVIQFAFSSKVQALAGVIVSRKGNDGVWKRSNASLLLNPNVSDLEYPSMQDCLDAAVSGSIDTLNARYLNNSGTGRVEGQTTVVEPVTVTALAIGGQSIIAGGEAVTLDASQATASVAIDDTERTGLKLAVCLASGGNALASANIVGGSATLQVTMNQNTNYVMKVMEGSNVLYTSAQFNYQQAPITVSTMTANTVNVKAGQADVTLDDDTLTAAATFSGEVPAGAKLALRKYGQQANVREVTISGTTANLTNTLEHDVFYVLVVLDGANVIYTSAKFKVESNLSEG